MIPILMAMLLAAPNPGSSIPERRMTLRDQLQGPTPVTDKMLIPSRVPDCVGSDQIRQAEDEKIKGWEPECMLPRIDRSKQSLPH